MDYLLERNGNYYTIIYYQVIKIYVLAYTQAKYVSEDMCE